MSAAKDPAAGAPMVAAKRSEVEALLRENGELKHALDKALDEEKRLRAERDRYARWVKTLGSRLDEIRKVVR